MLVFAQASGYTPGRGADAMSWQDCAWDGTAQSFALLVLQGSGLLAAGQSFSACLRLSWSSYSSSRSPVLEVFRDAHCPSGGLTSNPGSEWRLRRPFPAKRGSTSSSAAISTSRRWTCLWLCGGSTLCGGICSARLWYVSCSRYKYIHI